MSPDTPAIQDHYPDDFAHCYGCGQRNEHGLRLRTWWEGEETISRFTPAPYHTALPGSVYGGLVASLIDCHGTGSASAAALRRDGREIGEGPSPRFVTAALQVDYVKPTPLGPELEVRGRILEIKERKVVVESTLSAEGVVTARGRVVAVRLRSDMAEASDSGKAPEA
jgi:acyl-coenzyme A thioesterase PaaI-like protein